MFVGMFSQLYDMYAINIASNSYHVGLNCSYFRVDVNNCQQVENFAMQKQTAVSNLFRLCMKVDYLSFYGLPLFESSIEFGIFVLPLLLFVHYIVILKSTIKLNLLYVEQL